MRLDNAAGMASMPVPSGDHLQQDWSWRGKLAFYRRLIDALGIVGAGARSVALRGLPVGIPSSWSDHSLHLRPGTSDAHVFDSVFVDREYRCLDGLSGIQTIVDAGANVGYSSAYLLSRFPGSRVVAIEPDTGNFSAMRRNLAPWGDRVIPLQAALWSERTNLSLKAETAEQGDEWGRQVQASGAGEVQALSISDVMQEQGWAGIDLLKIDIEGAEEAVFQAPDLAWLGRVRNIVIELHGEACRTVFTRAIAPHDFALTTCDELTVCLRK